MTFHRPPVPGTVRLSLAALLVVGMALAWREGWWLIIPGVALVLLLGWWRGTHLTAIAARWLGVLARNRRRGRGVHSAALDVRATATLEVDGPAEQLPLPALTSYLDRYGIRCAAVCVTTRVTNGEHTTWIGLTVSAADNLAALQARSARMPLEETVNVVARRLAGHLRELGWTVHVVDADTIPAVVEPTKETWRGVRDGRGYVAAYQVRDGWAETFPRVWSHPFLEAWTSLRFSGDPAGPTVRADCALRTPGRPSGKPPIVGLRPYAGEHGRVLATMCR